MKKIFFLLLVFPVILVSCSDDDDNGYKNSDIVGTWSFDKAIPKTVLVVGENSAEAKAAIEEDVRSLALNEKYVFTVDGRLTIYPDGKIYDEGIYAFRDKNIEVKTYKINGIYQINISNGSFQIYYDEKSLYSIKILSLIENPGNITVSEVIVEYTYRKE